MPPKGQHVMMRNLQLSTQILTLLHQGAVLDIQSLEDITGLTRRSAYRYFDALEKTLPLVVYEARTYSNPGRGCRFKLMPESRMLRRG